MLQRVGRGPGEAGKPPLIRRPRCEVRDLATPLRISAVLPAKMHVKGALAKLQPGRRTPVREAFLRPPQYGKPGGISKFWAAAAFGKSRPGPGDGTAGVGGSNLAVWLVDTEPRGDAVRKGGQVPKSTLDLCSGQVGQTRGASRKGFRLAPGQKIGIDQFFDGACGLT